MSIAGLILLILGALGLLLSVAGALIMAFSGFGVVADNADQMQVFDSGNGSFTFESGEEVQLYAVEGSPTPTCSVFSPDGQQPGSGTTQTSTLSVDGRTWESFASLVAPSSGEYQVDCAGTPVMVGPPVSIGGMFTGVGGVLLGVFGGVFSLLLLVVGIVLMVVGRKRARR